MKLKSKLQVINKFIALLLSITLTFTIQGLTTLTINVSLGPNLSLSTHQRHAVSAHAIAQNNADILVYRSKRFYHRNYDVMFMNASPTLRLEEKYNSHHANLFLPPAQLGIEFCTIPTNISLGVSPSFPPNNSNNDTDTDADADTDTDTDASENNQLRGRIRRTMDTGADQQSDNKSSSSSIKENVLRFLRSEEMGTTWDRRYISNIALLVFNGPTCSIQDQADNARKLNEYYSVSGGPKISYLVLFDRITGTEKDHDIVPIDFQVNDDAGVLINNSDTEEDVNGEDNNKNNKLNVLQISPIGSIRIQTEMQFIDRKYGESRSLNKEAFYPFENKFRNYWSYPIRMERLQLQPHSHFSSWRWTFLAFLFLLSLPLFRSCFLVCCTERRFVVRRTRNGWGIRIVRTTDRSNLSVFEYEPTRFLSFPINLKNTLTKEQVEELPLIEYNVTDLEDAVRKYSLAKRDDVGNVEGEEKLQLSKTISIDEDSSKCCDSMNDEKEGEEGNESGSEIGMELVTCSFLKKSYAACTGCSICICDFTQGEELRLLPRCGHTFHHDCLLPWLTEQKNICPLCQTLVIEEDVEETNSLVVLNDDS